MYYLGDDIHIAITLNEDISLATEIKVCYKKPDSTDIFIDTNTGISGTTVVLYDLLKVNNDQIGTWKFFVKVTDADGFVATSTEMTLDIAKHFTL